MRSISSRCRPVSAAGGTCPMPAHSRPCYDAPCPMHGPMPWGRRWWLVDVRRHPLYLEYHRAQVHAIAMLHRRPPPSSATIPTSNNVDGQTNWMNFFPFVCPSQVHASPPTPPSSASNNVDRQTNWTKFIQRNFLSVVELGAR